MRLPIGVAAYRRQNGNMPEQLVRNMTFETAPTATSGGVLISRNGLTDSHVVGDGPVRGLFQQAGLFNGDMFAVSGPSLYRGTTLLGSISGLGPVSFAAIRNILTGSQEVAVTAGSVLYSYNGTDLQAVAFPDDQLVTSVAALSQRFIATVADSHGYYWSDTDDGRTWQGDAFASAESSPDDALEAVVMRGTLYIVGQTTIEPFFPTGDNDLPFQPIQQRTFSRGALRTGCTAVVDNTLFWIGDDAIVYRMGDIPEAISDAAISELVTGSALASAFSYTYQGHAFFVIRLDDGCRAYDAATRQWSEPHSHGLDRYRVMSAVNVGSQAYFGTDQDGTIAVYGDDYSDLGTPLVRAFSSYLPLTGPEAIDNVWLDVNVGRTPYLSGLGAQPVIELRHSGNGGATFSAWETASMGAQGEYGEMPEWWALGTFNAPGVLFEFRCSDPIPLRVSSAFVNEPQR